MAQPTYLHHLPTAADALDECKSDTTSHSESQRPRSVPFEDQRAPQSISRFYAYRKSPRVPASTERLPPEQESPSEIATYQGSLDTGPEENYTCKSARIAEICDGEPDAFKSSSKNYSPYEPLSSDDSGRPRTDTLALANRALQHEVSTEDDLHNPTLSADRSVDERSLCAPKDRAPIVVNSLPLCIRRQAITERIAQADKAFPIQSHASGTKQKTIVIDNIQSLAPKIRARLVNNTSTLSGTVGRGNGKGGQGSANKAPQLNLSKSKHSTSSSPRADQSQKSDSNNSLDPSESLRKKKPRLNDASKKLKFPCVFHNFDRQQPDPTEHCCKLKEFVCQLRVHHGCMQHNFFYCAGCFTRLNTASEQETHPNECLGPKCVTEGCQNMNSIVSPGATGPCWHRENSQYSQWCALFRLARPGEIIPHLVGLDTGDSGVTPSSRNDNSQSPSEMPGMFSLSPAEVSPMAEPSNVLESQSSWRLMPSNSSANPPYEEFSLLRDLQGPWSQERGLGEIERDDFTNSDFTITQPQQSEEVYENSHLRAFAQSLWNELISGCLPSPERLRELQATAPLTLTLPQHPQPNDDDGRSETSYSMQPHYELHPATVQRQNTWPDNPLALSSHSQAHSRSHQALAYIAPYEDSSSAPRRAEHYSSSMAEAQDSTYDSTSNASKFYSDPGS